MKNLVKILPLIAAISLVSCKKDQTADQLIVEETVLEVPVSAEEAKAEDIKIAQSKPLTTVALSQAHYDFGKIKKGDHTEHVYEITNTGENPLIISQVKPGCGCTVPDYSKEPILPGQKGQVTLKFDSSAFDGLVNKQADIYANVEKAPMEITFSADVQPK